MRKLYLPPDQAGYSAKPGLEVLSAQLDGGAPRYRRDVIGATARVTLQWTLVASALQYLQAFYRTGVSRGADWFLIDLILDGAAMAEYQAHFVPGSFEIKSRQGRGFVVGAELDVVPCAADEAFDEAIIGLFEAGGYGRAGMPDLLEQLGELVNENLPDYLR